MALPGGGMQCRFCRVQARTKASLRTFRAIPCRGRFRLRAHSTHRLNAAHGVLWCGACGAYAVERMVALSKPCPRKPLSAAAGQRLARLRAGEVPAASELAASRLGGLLRGVSTGVQPVAREARPVGVYLRLQPEVATSRLQEQL